MKMGVQEEGGHWGDTDTETLVELNTWLRCMPKSHDPSSTFNINTFKRLSQTLPSFAPSVFVCLLSKFFLFFFFFCAQTLFQVLSPLLHCHWCRHPLHCPFPR
jgi:hypothetical protein